MMSVKYRSMIMVAVATIMFYEKEVVITPDLNPDTFRIKYQEIVERVFLETRSVFEYELSSHQLDVAISAYLTSKRNPQSPKDIPVFTLKKA